MRGGTRFFNGIVQRFCTGRARTQTLTAYHAEIVPWLWLLTLTVRLPDLPEDVGPRHHPGGLHRDLASPTSSSTCAATYPPRDYCVQYRETDFNFVTRLMEQYGIYYFFEHGDGKHTLVLADTPAGHPDCKPDTARFNWSGGAVLDRRRRRTASRSSRRFGPGKYALTDYNF